MDQHQRELADRASSHWNAHQWLEAGDCYEELANTNLHPLNKAKIFANLMRCMAEQGKVEKSIAAGERALAEAEKDWSTKGAFIHGYVVGQLRTLRGGSYQWWRWLAPLPGYSIGAALGASICKRIAEAYPVVQFIHTHLPAGIHLHPLTQLVLFIQFGALLGGLISQLVGPWWVLGQGLSIAGGVMSHIILVVIIPSNGVGTSISALLLLTLPWMIAPLLAHRMKRAIGCGQRLG